MQHPKSYGKSICGQFMVWTDASESGVEHRWQLRFSTITSVYTYAPKPKVTTSFPNDCTVHIRCGGEEFRIDSLTREMASTLEALARGQQ